MLNRAFEHADLVDELDEKEDEIEALQQGVEELNMRISDHNDLREENERLRNEKRALIQHRNGNQELAEFAKQERSLQERREQRERQKEAAPIWKRTEWFVFGRS